MTASLDDETLVARVAAYQEHGSQAKAATALGIARATLQHSLRQAAERGLLPTAPIMPGFAIKTVSSKDKDGAWVKQGKSAGAEFEVPDGHLVKGVSALVDAEGRETLKWVKTNVDAERQQEAMQAALAAMIEDMPRATAITPPANGIDDLLCQYTITDNHLGMLAWAEETGGDDYDLKEAEALLLDWFSAAIALAPNSQTAVLAQLGDLLHYDTHDSVTPAHKHVLDGDSRIQKMVRVCIRTVRRIIDMLLAKHDRVHVIMAEGNHDETGSVWLREMLADRYENEPRVTIDSSPDVYYAFEFGNVSLFYHHGHKRKVANVDHVFAGKFRGMYGRTAHSYGHVGHLHSDHVEETNLMRVERHRTLAPSDAYASRGGWQSGRDAKVITYHRNHGEVSRLTLSPDMVAGANNNEPTKEVA